MDRKKARDKIVDTINDLPTLPDVIHRLLPLLQDDDVSINALLDVIGKDLAISMRLLKVANSAYYGCMSQITTVRHAITILGLRQVKSLALGISVFDTMRGLEKKGPLDYTMLWVHSIGTAMAAQLMSKFVSDTDSETAFTAALLHDIGKIPLNALFPDECRQVAKKALQGMDCFEAEEEVFQFNHGDVGGWLCVNWKLPAALVQPVQYHHHYKRSSAAWKDLTSLIHCADVMSKLAGIGTGTQPVKEIAEPNADTATPQEDLSAVLSKKRQTDEQQTSAVPFPSLAVLENLQLNITDLNTVLTELAAGDQKARSFFNAIS